MSCRNETGEDYKFVQGNTWIIAVELTDDGVAEDLTGASIIVTLKESLEDADPGAMQYVHVVPAGADAEAGRTRIEVPSNLTDVDSGSYYLGLKRVFPGAPPAVWTFFLEPDVEVMADVSLAVA